MVKNTIQRHTEVIYPTHHNRPILIDTRHLPSTEKQPVVIFCHGYKGFKDWGAWNLVADAFAQAGYFFVKFNFSHNGGTIEQPIDFPDLEAFGQNTYKKEVDDLHCVLNWLQAQKKIQNAILDIHQITLIGHSRGGGIASIVASEAEAVKHLITWASVSDYKSRFPKGEAFTQWEKDGVYYVANGRTKQQMPHYFTYYTSFVANEARLTIQNAVATLSIPHFILHGTADTSVPLQNAYDLHTWNPKSTLVTISEANHVFGMKHPWEQAHMPDHLLTVIQETIAFIKNS